MAFLDKLKRKVDVIEAGQAKAAADGGQKTELHTGSNFAQIEVDIYQTTDKFIICAAIPGVDADKISISINEDNDTVTIQGKKESPIEKLRAEDKSLVPHHQECPWGEFYRQIVLPQEVNAEQISAYEEKGILIVVLPILRLQKGNKDIKVEIKQ
jgi:HSP20 family protein